MHEDSVCVLLDYNCTTSPRTHSLACSLIKRQGAEMGVATAAGGKNSQMCRAEGLKDQD